MARLRAIASLGAVKKHIDRMKQQPLREDVAKVNGYSQRIQQDVAAIDGLTARANIAIRTIGDGVAELRIPEAVAAIRTARAAVRLLFSQS